MIGHDYMVSTSSNRLSEVADRIVVYGMSKEYVHVHCQGGRLRSVSAQMA